MNEKQKICCFPGLRPTTLPFGYDEDSPDCLRLKVRLYFEVDQMREKGVTVFLTGLAPGIDMIAAEIVLDIKRAYPFDDIRLVILVPGKEEADQWPEAYRERYFHILERADEVVTLKKRHAGDGMLKRNRYMLKTSSHLIAVWGGSETKQTIDYAVKKGLDVIVINPDTLQREHIPSSRPH
jgi:uncharacterized phage-like protein YoqJ